MPSALQGDPAPCSKPPVGFDVKGCILVHGSYTKTQLQINVNGRFRTRCWVTLYSAVQSRSQRLLGARVEFSHPLTVVNGTFFKT